MEATRNRTTSPPIAVSPNLKKSPITGSQHLTTLKFKYSDVQTSDRESVSHQTSHSVSASLSDVMRCRKSCLWTMVCYPLKHKNLSATDCMKNLKHSLANAKDYKQKVPVKKHKRSKKKTVQVTLHQCQDFYLKK
jgi:hypothetical protein